MDIKKVRVIYELPGGNDYPIRPRDIKLSEFPKGNFYIPGTFGKHEIEVAAARLVLFCQIRGGWLPFTLRDLSNFYQDLEFDPKVMLFGLFGAWEDNGELHRGIRLAPPYIVADTNGLYRVTDLFIEKVKGAT